MVEVNSVRVGTVIPPLTKSASNVSLFMYSAAIGLTHRIHYDRAFAVEHEGLPDVVGGGTLAADWLAEMLYSWGGAGLVITRLRYENRGYILVDAALTCSGRISERRDTPASTGFAADVWIRDAAGHDVTVGDASFEIRR